MTLSRQKAAPTKPLFLRLLLLCLTFAFLTQSLAVQTHIHGGPLSGTAHVTQVSNPAQPGTSDPYDPANCPLCQEMLHAGGYILPPIAGVVVGLTAAFYVAFFALLPHPATARQHNWQSRAPPRH